MRRLILLCTVLLTVGTTAARAGLHLSYDDCGGPTNLDSACTSNTGAFYIVASFDAPAGSIAIDGGQGVFDAQFADGAVPPWWQAVTTGSCRGYAVSLQYNNPAPSCADYFNTVSYPLGGYAYDWYPASPTTPPGRVRIRTVSAIDTNMATSFEAQGITPGTNTYVNTIVVRMNKTVGAGACPGCNVAACWVFNSLLLHQPIGVGPNIMIASPGIGGAYVTWQGGAVGSGPFGSGCPGATPARTTSWGQLKGLYR